MDESSLIEKMGHDLCTAITAIKTEAIISAAEMIKVAFEETGTLYTFGNGGSAAQAEHFVAELVGRFEGPESKSLPAVALTGPSAVLTSTSNDYGFANCFSRQVQALVKPFDIVLGISTSGASKNVQEGLLAASKQGANCIFLTGGNTDSGLSIPGYLWIKAPSYDTQRIQECHLFMLHMIAMLVKRSF